MLFWNFEPWWVLTCTSHLATALNLNTRNHKKPLQINVLFISNVSIAKHEHPPPSSCLQYIRKCILSKSSSVANRKNEKSMLPALAIWTKTAPILKHVLSKSTISSIMRDVDTYVLLPKNNSASKMSRQFSRSCEYSALLDVLEEQKRGRV